MPYNTQNFQPLSLAQVSPFGYALQQGVQGIGQGADLYKHFLDSQKMKLAIQQEQARKPYYGQFAQAELAKAQAEPNEINARTGLYGAQSHELNVMTPEKLKELQLKNQFYPQQIQAEIANNKALTDWRKSGGFGNNSGFGTGAREEMLFQNLVQKDNPQLKTPEQIYEASNVLRSGGDKLSDGTQLNPLSPAAQASYDRLLKGTTTSGAVTPIIQANAASKEMQVLNNFAQEGIKPYGTTIYNIVPEQIIDTFKNDNASQERLGNFIASQQLQYDLAQNSIKVAMGQPGVNSTQELMQLGQQSINAKYPRLSAKARAAANARYQLALEKGLEARKEAGISISNALKVQKSKGTKDSPIKLVIKNGKLVEEQ
jgi:hypothetical protein